MHRLINSFMKPHVVCLLTAGLDINRRRLVEENWPDGLHHHLRLAVSVSVASLTRGRIHIYLSII
jgi:hypothetical protein